MNNVASVFRSTPASVPSLQFQFLLDDSQYLYNSWFANDSQLELTAAEDPWLTLKLSTSGKKCVTSK